MSPTRRVIIALAAGLAGGLAISASQDARLLSLASFVEPVGKLWVNAIRMTVVPLVASGEFADTGAWLRTAAVFAAFCALASAIYVVNDLSDLSADRKHHRKSRRPFASGALSIIEGVALLPLLLIIGGMIFAAAGSDPGCDANFASFCRGGSSAHAPNARINGKMACLSRFSRTLRQGPRKPA